MLRQVVGIGLCLTVFTAAPVKAERHPGQTVNIAPPLIYVGAQKMRVSPIVDRGRVLVPVRGVFEALGADVSYSAPHIVIVRKAGTVIAAFILGRMHAIAGQHAVDLDVPAMRRDGRIYVPLRVVAEAAGAMVAYTSNPAAVHVSLGRGTSPVAAASDSPSVDATAVSDEPQAPSTTTLRIGVAIVTGLCCLGCVMLTARRFAPTLFSPAQAKRLARPPESVAAVLHVPPPDSVALKSVESAGEARFHKQLVTETRTLEVPVTREELVIEYAGQGGTVIIQGRTLEPGETVRIPLWEERVHVDVTKHMILKEDIVIDKRRTGASMPAPERIQPQDPNLAEGSPS